MSKRIARICTHKDCVPPNRQFGKPGWVCPEHGAHHTKDQPNKPYFGKPT